MKKIHTNLTLVNAAYLIITLYALYFAATKPIIYFPDSDGYLVMSIFRTCGYPLFIKAHQFLYGMHFETGIIATQFALDILSALFLVRCIRQSTALNQWLSVILYLIILFPVFMGIITANTVLSEGLAYPLYLFVVGNIFRGSSTKLSKYFYYALVLTFLLVLVRGQFLFLVVVIILAIALTYYRSLLKRQTIVLIVTAFLIPFLSVFTDILFHKIQHHRAVTTPLTGIQIIAIPFYVSNENDYTAFETKEQQEHFKFVYATLKERKLLASQLTPAHSKVDFFCDHYIDICNNTISIAAMDKFYPDKTYKEKFILNDKITSAMTIPLIKRNFKSWCALYFGNFTKGFDTSKYFLLYAILLLMAVIQFLKKEDYLSKIIILLILLPIGNASIVALAEATIGRYMFYNNWVLFLIIFLLFQDKFYNKTNE